MCIYRREAFLMLQSPPPSCVILDVVNNHEEAYRFNVELCANDTQHIVAYVTMHSKDGAVRMFSSKMVDMYVHNVVSPGFIHSLSSGREFVSVSRWLHEDASLSDYSMIISAARNNLTNHPELWHDGDILEFSESMIVPSQEKMKILNSFSQEFSGRVQQ